MKTVVFDFFLRDELLCRMNDIFFVFRVYVPIFFFSGLFPRAQVASLTSATTLSLRTTLTAGRLKIDCPASGNFFQ